MQIKDGNDGDIKPDQLGEDSIDPWKQTAGWT